MGSIGVVFSPVPPPSIVLCPPSAVFEAGIIMVYAFLYLSRPAYRVLLAIATTFFNWLVVHIPPPKVFSHFAGSTFLKTGINIIQVKHLGFALPA